jgi:hypothetical protein
MVCKVIAKGAIGLKKITALITFVIMKYGWR